MHNPSFNMVYPAFRSGHGKLCHMNFLTSTTVLLKEEEFIDQNRTELTLSTVLPVQDTRYKKPFIIYIRPTS